MLAETSVVSVSAPCLPQTMVIDRGGVVNTKSKPDQC